MAPGKGGSDIGSAQILSSIEALSRELDQSRKEFDSVWKSASEVVSRMKDLAKKIAASEAALAQAKPDAEREAAKVTVVPPPAAPEKILPVLPIKSQSVSSRDELVLDVEEFEIGEEFVKNAPKAESASKRDLTDSDEIFIGDLS